MIRAICPILFAVAAMACHAATYYFDSERGADANSGISDRAPWKTLDKLNATRFQPGDRILLKSGSVWQGQLAPAGSGREGASIVIDRYGKGPRPHIDGAGRVEDAIRLYNVEWIEVRNLEVTNQGAAPAIRRGVHIFLDNFGAARHIVVAGLYIHDVNGSNQRKDNGGIIFRTNGNQTPSRFDGLTIERNIVWKVDRSAIAAQSYHSSRRRWFPSLNVIIRDNFVDDIGGDGIVPWATDGVLVEHNIARDCNRRAGSYNAGIWPWSTDNSLFQLNEASFTRTTRDGEGFDSDYNSQNTIFQYNYSHDNEGGFMLICTPGHRNPQDNIGNLGTVIRYNISRNDRSRIFHLSGGDHTLVEHNAIYIGPGLEIPILLTSDWQGWANDAVFRENTFRAEGVARYGHGLKHEDGTYALEPGWGGAKGIEFEGNQYIGHHVDHPPDAKGQESGVPAPKLDWNSPQFDPSKPDEFDRFVEKHRAWMMRLFVAQFGEVKLGREQKKPQSIRQGPVTK
ncbi:MAG TPA: right-handed parallel beta-helix repeat-containing protein [Bryobacteraceae bacterium]|nr:right-handed parallel beta-helix repeat-containing protein [Bryobacteraceae bacterium]